jgi:hypothetical protein
MGDSPTPDLESLIKFHKRSQPFIRTRNKTISVVAMCVSNKDRSPIAIQG